MRSDKLLVEAFGEEFVERLEERQLNERLRPLKRLSNLIPDRFKRSKVKVYHRSDGQSMTHLQKGSSHVIIFVDRNDNILSNSTVSSDEVDEVIKRAENDGFRLSRAPSLINRVLVAIGVVSSYAWLDFAYREFSYQRRRRANNASSSDIDFEDDPYRFDPMAHPTDPEMTWNRMDRYQIPRIGGTVVGTDGYHAISRSTQKEMREKAIDAATGSDGRVDMDKFDEVMLKLIQDFLGW